MATVGQIIAIIIAPAKLETAASARAFLGVSDLVETHPAIALGASVQPLTKATPKTRREKNIFISCLPPLRAYCLKLMILEACLITLH